MRDIVDPQQSASFGRQGSTKNAELKVPDEAEPAYAPRIPSREELQQARERL